MSGLMVGLVLESGLAPRLKLVAVAMANFANNDGSSVYPSVQRVAWMVGVSDRHVRRTLSELRSVGVLVEEASLGHATTRYRFNVEALPQRQPYSPSINWGDVAAPDPATRYPCVYVVQAGDLVKIGYSAQLLRRTWSLLKNETHCGELTVLAVIAGDRALETRLHKMWARYRVRGDDWFAAHTDLLTWAVRVREGLWIDDERGPDFRNGSTG